LARRKNKLGHVLGQMRVGAHQPQRRGIDEIDIAPGQFTERGLGAGLRVFGGQLLVFVHLQSNYKPPRRRETGQKSGPKPGVRQGAACSRTAISSPHEVRFALPRFGLASSSPMVERCHASS
jgi:hypothetical protein